MISQNNNSYSILASGNGSNANQILQHAQTNNYLHKIKCVITDNSNAHVIQRAKQFDIPVYVVKFQNDKEVFETDILEILKGFEVNWLLLAGFLKILSEKMLSHFFNDNYQVNQVINIHPSLLPAYPGLNSYERAYKDEVKKSGVTVHFVDSGIDTGPIIMQKSFNRYAQDSLEKFITRGLELEHEIYPQVVDMIESRTIFTKEQ